MIAFTNLMPETSGRRRPMIQHVKHAIIYLRTTTLQMPAMPRSEMSMKVAMTARLRLARGGKDLIRNNFAAACLLQSRS